MMPFARISSKCLRVRPGRWWMIAVLLPLTFSLAGCGLFSRGDDSGSPTATPAATVALLPTFTPTPQGATATLAVPTAVVPVVTVVSIEEPSAPITQTESVTAGITSTLPVVMLPTATLPAQTAPSNQFTLATDANLRSGPGTDYPLAGATTAGQVFVTQGRNAAGDWLHVCCVADQPVWVYAPLGTLAGSAEALAVVETAPLPTPQPVAAAPTESALVEATPLEAAPQEAAIEPAPVEPPAAGSPYPPGGPIVDHPGTAGDFSPDAQYQIVHFKVLGEAENNGGIFNSGGQHMIFVTVLDQAGNGMDEVVLKDAIGDKLNVVTGNKGPGKTEIDMYWDGYKLYVASDATGPVTSQISNRLNLSFPHLPDVIGKLGSLENDISVCPTPDVRCEPPFYHVHFSYEITFQKVR